MKRVLCVHTAEMHTGTFGHLFEPHARDVDVSHVVKPEWLEEARRTGLTQSLTSQIVRFLIETARTHDAVLCSCSTLGPAVAIARRDQPNIVRIDDPLVQKAWPYFERGETQKFAAAIAAKIRAVVGDTSNVGCIVLAQASMAVAEPHLEYLGVPIYTSPSLAVEEVLRVVGAP